MYLYFFLSFNKHFHCIVLHQGHLLLVRTDHVKYLHQLSTDVEFELKSRFTVAVEGQ